MAAVIQLNGHDPAPFIDNDYDPSIYASYADTLNAEAVSSSATSPPLPSAHDLPKAQESKRINWASLRGKQPPPRKWAIDQWLGVGHLTLCIGPGGIGKTLIAQQTASHLTIGRNFIGNISASHRVLMWACEDDHDELWRRQLSIADKMSLPIDAFNDLDIRPRVGMENTLMTTEFGRPMWTPLIGLLAEEVADSDADVVILDNIGQIFGANELSRHDVTMFINGVTGACTRRKPTSIILLGHPARAAGSEFAGSAAWENAVRMRWFFNNKLPDDKTAAEDAVKDDDARYLCKRKTNYAAKDYLKFSYDCGAFVPEEIADGCESNSAYRNQQAKRVVIDGIEKLRAMGMNSSEASGKTYLPSLLVSYQLHEGIEKSLLAWALKEMMVEGKIVRAVVGKMANRMDKFGLVVA